MRNYPRLVSKLISMVDRKAIVDISKSISNRRSYVSSLSFNQAKKKKKEKKKRVKTAIS